MRFIFNLSKSLFFGVLVLVIGLGIFSYNFALAQTGSVDMGKLSVGSENASSRIAPGEFLPVSVKLINFGYEKRIDVIVDYKIFNNSDKEAYLQQEVYSESETVAVETTASFIKRIQLPYSLDPGYYTLVTVLHYPYQEQPAVSKFPFLVEKKFGGFFQSDLLLYGGLIAVVLLVVILITFLFSRGRRMYGVVHFDYSDKPKNEIIYYEILSDVIAQMRLRVGDKAIDMARDIPELEINDKTGMIMNIKKNPAKITALLISRYESLIGNPISFDLKK